MIERVRISFYPEELLTIHDRIGYVRGLLCGLRASVEDLESDQALLKDAIESLTQVYDMLRDEKRLTFESTEGKKK